MKSSYINFSVSRSTLDVASSVTIILLFCIIILHKQIICFSPSLNDNEAIKACVPYLINNVSGSVKDVVEIRFTVDGGGAKAAVYECFDETDSVATAAGDSSTCTSQCESGHTCTWQVKTPEVAATYINYASNKYLDMFKLGAKEDGSRVQV
jgi:hypothetical protein